ncbi:MAG: hypothetical protein A3F16_02725 [Deltaproteobacteria bacterium RIFCSPHIGHO2_12_FULL_43_9]|nr:MAG: hypothetical protein A3F16_02725 [Deltaproteobacteria bacterium RIFCSPHIGHO2_12_FULL_43_9]
MEELTIIYPQRKPQPYPQVYPQGFGFHHSEQVKIDFSLFLCIFNWQKLFNPQVCIKHGHIFW